MFNPHARWDRHLPGQGAGESQLIEVCARFTQGKIVPLHFILSGNRFTITRINYIWNERKGRVNVRYFSVADGHDTYCLYLDTELMSWYYIPV
jgi:hypothetical protein